MNEDKKLLEMAAKSVGGQIRFDISPDGWPWLQTVLNGEPQPYPVRWNPLTDDGDALRLAVKLKLIVSPWGGTIYVNKAGANPIDVKEDWGPKGDPCKATRRAIVRAAAEIGKTL